MKGGYNMFCPKCGKINPDSGEKCSGCGAVLHEEVEVTPKKKNHKVLKIVIAAVVVIAVVVAIVLLTGCSGEIPDINERITY